MASEVFVAIVAAGSAIAGGAISSTSQFVIERSRRTMEETRATRKRAHFVMDRTRSERHATYKDLLVNARQAVGRLQAIYNGAQFGEIVTVGPEHYDQISARVLGDYGDIEAQARLVASATVRAQIERVGKYLRDGVWGLVDHGGTQSMKYDGLWPLRGLEEAMTLELRLRDDRTMIDEDTLESKVEALFDQWASRQEN